ncbi:LEVG family PEP-CTERM protein [Crocosphaera chwakensis]|uniref:Peptide deformylase n=1 Tax=Crocosphaera chwakensis CCY0110 TaxID=391612 RepID=A3IZD0_9CHRO|nr:LEVG family PEP-CTERM protein [Crocosphaera chwakensis]EAZ88163.1 peptide deformylase [Crocosphaera chwakensis CCY0110]
MSLHKQLLSQYLLPLAVTGVTTIGVNTVFVSQVSAQVSLVPQQEGEIFLNNGLGDFNGSNFSCLDGNSSPTCINLTTSTAGLISSVVSLSDNSSGEQSRLFVDNLLTASSYGGGVVSFGAGDRGTNPSGYWFRPSEVNEENGQLEVGTFRFEFAQIIPELTVHYFDTERNGETGVDDGTNSFGVTGVNAGATLLSGFNPVPAGPDSNIRKQTWGNVSFITLTLGFDKPNSTGDGVDFQLETPPNSGNPAAVPEPLTILGAGAAMGFGGFFKKKLAKSSNKENKA